MSALRTLLASLLILGAGVAALSAATDGFEAFTTDSARRLDIQHHPRAVPEARLETTDRRTVTPAAWRGRWILVDFIYTRCTTWCMVQGAVFSQLQDRLATPIADGKVMLLSVSFDPDHDGPSQLAEYLDHSGDRGQGWVAARPTDGNGLLALKQTFGVTVIPDGAGGFVHNSAIAVIDPAGRLMDLLPWNDAKGAAEWILHRVEP